MLRYKRATREGKVINTHYYIQCLQTKQGGHCSFDERLSKTQDGTHECQFSTGQLTIKQMLQLNKTGASPVLIDADLVSMHARFVMNSGISFTMGTSQLFYEFLDSVIARSLKAPEHLSPHSIYPHVTRKQMRKKITEQASIKYSSLLLSLKEKTVCITIDAGTLLNSHYVIICISNPFASIKSHLIRLITTDGSMDQDGYSRLAADIIVFFRNIPSMFVLL